MGPLSTSPHKALPKTIPIAILKGSNKAEKKYEHTAGEDPWFCSPSADNMVVGDHLWKWC